MSRESIKSAPSVLLPMTSIEDDPSSSATAALPLLIPFGGLLLSSTRRLAVELSAEFNAKMPATPLENFLSAIASASGIGEHSESSALVLPLVLK
eukprot:XP_001708565.1 Hypothetical protein GL50803_97140 [Giardia lamblia ATCC 50803]